MNASRTTPRPGPGAGTTLSVRTVEVPEVDALLDRLPSGLAGTEVMSWVREGEGLVGWGRAAACRSSGASRFADAEDWWHRLVAGAEVSDEVALPGSGLVAFGSFAFADDSPRGGSLLVPEVVIGRRGGRSWVTTVSPGRGGGARWGAPAAPRITDVRPGAVSAAQWPHVIAGAVARIRAGEVDKVVLARDVVATARGGVDLRWVLGRLSRRYHRTWTFAVEGLVGATPELLVRLEDGWVSSRVLAGTVCRASAATRDDRARVGLVASAKDRQEHAYAVRSVVDVLRPHCGELHVPEEPFVLELPNVFHLASDVSGGLSTGTTSLRLAGELHPSAAVCGSPQPVAAAMIAELEGMDRGRYAGPVGWMDAAGDGEWGIALRCGELAPNGSSIRLFAGGGIVADSDPQAELAETEAKLAPMRHALGLD